MALTDRFPEARRPAVHANRLLWTVELQPTPGSVVYTVRIVAVRGRHPHVTVLHPLLQLPSAEPLPHVFPGDELCLYYDEFDPAVDLIADTIVPWCSEWLHFYELWVTTGEWLGGGVHATRPRELEPDPEATHGR